MNSLSLQKIKKIYLLHIPSMRDPVYREEDEAFLSWWGKTPLARRHQKSIELEIQAKLEKESGADKKRRK